MRVLRRAVLVKLLLTALAVSSCAWVPVEEHGGLSPKPAPSDWLFIGSGAVVDGGLQLAHVGQPWRAVADVTAALVVRTWKPLGRSESSHLLMLTGSFSTTFLRVIVRGSP